MASIGSILQRNDQTIKVGYEVKLIHYTKVRPSSMQNREERNIESFADILEEAGEIKQPLLVRKSIGDTYEVLAGHRRRLAAIYNVEKKGLKQFEFLPCKIDKSDDVNAEINLITTNITIDVMTEVEKLEAVVRLKELLPKKYGKDLKGRALREKIASTLDLSTSKIAKLEAVSNNLIEDGKNLIKENKLPISNAYEMSTLDKESQQKLIDKGKLDLDTIKKEKNEKKEPSEKHILYPVEEDCENISLEKKLSNFRNDFSYIEKLCLDSKMKRDCAQKENDLKTYQKYDVIYTALTLLQKQIK